METKAKSLKGIKRSVEDMEGLEAMEDMSDSQYNRNSFDRFGDDFCELLLSFLTLKDKIVLEMVSKQWKQTIYNKQTILRVFSVHPIEAIPHLTNHYLNDLLVPIVVKNFVSGFANNLNMRTIDCNRLKNLLLKCKYIKKIELTRVYVDSTLLAIIGHYCPNLESIQLDIIGLEEEDIDRFGRKYGKRLKQIKFNNCRPFSARDYSTKFFNDFGKKLLFYCQNIKSFICEDISLINNKSNEFMPKLESIDLRLKRNDAFSFSEFVNKYELKLKKLRLYSSEMEVQNLRSTLQQISHFRYIEVLDLTFNLMANNPENSNTINDKILEIAKNCPKMSRFMLNIHVFINGNEIIGGNIFDCLGKFVNLKHLNVSFKMSETHETVEHLKRLTHLTELSIRSSKIGDPFFKDIAIHLPALKTLQLQTEYDLSDILLESLSKLKHLTKISVGSGSKALKNITDSGIAKLLDSCPKLRGMTFYSRPQITTKTIDNLISFANKNRKNTINFFCGFSRLGDETQFPTIDLNAYKNIPQNLKINIRNIGNANLNGNQLAPHLLPVPNIGAQNVHLIEFNLNPAINGHLNGPLNGPLNVPPLQNLPNPLMQPQMPIPLPIPFPPPLADLPQMPLNLNPLQEFQIFFNQLPNFLNP